MRTTKWQKCQIFHTSIECRLFRSHVNGNTKCCQNEDSMNSILRYKPLYEHRTRSSHRVLLFSISFIHLIEPAMGKKEKKKKNITSLYGAACIFVICLRAGEIMYSSHFPKVEPQFTARLMSEHILVCKSRSVTQIDSASTQHTRTDGRTDD